MKRFLTAILILISCFLNADLHSQINFPESDLALGYNHSEVHARVAMPLDGENRIWIKGSEEYNLAILIDQKNNSQISNYELQPPFYTMVINANIERAKIKFCGKNNDCLESQTLFPDYYNAQKGKNFSVLLYGCVEPFMVDYKDGEPISGIFKGENNSSHRMRRLFKNVATHQNITYLDSVKYENSYLFKGKKDTTLLVSTPKVIINTGDQVYVDAGYETKMRHGDLHPLSAWETKRRPHPFNKDQQHYTSYLNSLYNATYSFTDIEEAHASLPLLATIDDHELRDGWGSQGDEYEEGQMNPELKSFYDLGKGAFINHQLALAPLSNDRLNTLENNTKTMDYSFNINGINGYILDLRSTRNIQNNMVLGDEQWGRFEDWLKNLETNQEVIIVTSIPLTLRPLKFFENIMKLFKPELRDDVRDGWSSKNNIKERDRLIAILTEYRIVNDIKPIFVSGDVHKSALIEIWVDPFVGRNSKHDLKETMILGYEVVASGLSHEFIKTGISKSIFKISESQRIGDGFIDFQYNNNRASLYPMVRKSVVGQNFGAIEFSETEKTKIHTFIFDQGNEGLEQHYLILDFEKKLPDNDYYIIKKTGSNNRIKREFESPLPHGMRVIND